MGTSSIVILPEVGKFSPSNILSSVLFLQPLEPITLTNCPDSTVKLTSFKAVNFFFLTV